MSEQKIKELEDKLNKTMSILSEYIGHLQSLEEQVRELTKANTTLIETVISGIKSKHNENLDNSHNTELDIPKRPVIALSDLLKKNEISLDDETKSKLDRAVDLVLKYGKSIPYLQ